MKIIKTPVIAKTRKLSATWTVEQSQDLEHHFSDDLAKILQEEIDREIIEEITGASLVEQGWTRVEQIIQVDLSWFEQYCVGKYKITSSKGIFFENSQDAILYILTWSTDETAYT